MLAAFLLYLAMFFGPVQQLSQVFDGYQQARVGLARIGELLRTPTSVPPAGRTRWPLDDLRGEVELRDVGFTYAGATTPALADFSLHVPPGRRPSRSSAPPGAGKSTVVKLVARFYDATAGTVLLDGVDIRDLDIADAAPPPRASCRRRRTCSSATSPRTSPTATPRPPRRGSSRPPATSAP